MALPRRGAANAAPPQEAKKKPVMSFKTMSDRTTSLETAIWANENEGDNGHKFTSYSITLSRSYRKEDGTWVPGPSFRPHDLPVVQFLIGKCYDWIMSEKTDAPI